MTNEALKNYLALAAIQDFREIMDTPYAGEAEGNSLFYRHQQKKMLKDPRKWYRERRKPVWKRMAQRAACFFLILLLGLGSAMAVSPTVRAAVVNFIKEVFQNQVIYRYTGQADDNGQEAELPDYQITNLPDGYIIEDVQDAAGLTVIYNLPNAADGKAAIVFYYGYMEDGSMLILDSGDDTFNVTEIQDGDFSGELYEYVDHPNDAKTLVWQELDRNIMFHISAHGDPDTLLSYARHVEEIKPPLRSTK